MGCCSATAGRRRLAALELNGRVARFNWYASYGLVEHSARLGWAW